MNDGRMYEDQQRNISQTITTKDKNRLRDMAYHWMEIALSDEMHEKKAAWKSVHDLKPTRPVITVNVPRRIWKSRGLSMRTI